MVTLGLTGGIACGKTSVARWLAARGARVIDADAMGRDLVDLGSPGLQAVVRRFGPEFLLPDGHLDRARLGAVVFADAQARADLNALLHPQLARAVRRQVEQLRGEDVPLCVIDAALLLEIDLRATCDAVLTVECPAELQVSRIMARNGLGRQQALDRVAAQWPGERRCALADWTIDNDGTASELEAASDRVLRAMMVRFPALGVGLAAETKT